MSKFIHLISTHNPIELDRIIYSLQNKGILINQKGQVALDAGNVELTGINGASIEVAVDQLEEAKAVLKEIGLASVDDPDSTIFVRTGLIFIITIFIVFILFAIYAFITQ